MMIRIACLSDLHGFLPQVPDCDLLLLGGDYSPNPATEKHWLCSTFRPWMRELVDRDIEIIGVAGNHDLLFETAPHMVPGLPWIYLQDSGTIFRGLNVYGSPWQKRFGDWAFNADEAFMAERWAAIPDDTDILLLHGPPHGCGDVVPDIETGQPIRVGSPSLARRIEEIQPRLVVCGHIHPGNGVYKMSILRNGNRQIGETTVINAAYVDDAYRPGQKIHMVDI